MGSVALLGAALAIAVTGANACLAVIAIVRVLGARLRRSTLHVSRSCRLGSTRRVDRRPGLRWALSFRTGAQWRPS
ncbi:hypothetical protein DPM33_30570 [Mesorhizobium hawassense]|uniref:Uncharacterized protein n=1 Tax=Mesorhizobium hawassense TaxID=1209954 RepID=A0A330H809_9HYPH|nr:hypothetical protein DPM33_30570 [Mesorhizobium hawassense]